MVNLTSPVGATSVPGALATSLAATLTGVRCDYAAVAGVSLAAVRIPSGTQLNANATAAELAAAIYSANAATACPPASRRALELADAVAPGSRALQGGASAAWAVLAVNIGAGTTQGGAAALAAAVLAAPATAFPLTTASWAPFWGYSSQSWLSTIGSPLGLVASSVTTLNAASYSSAPTVSPVPFALSSTQQLGLGLGIGLPLGLFLAAAAICAAAMCARRPSHSPHLLVVEEQTKAAPAAAAVAV